VYDYVFILALIGASLLWAARKASSDNNRRDSRFMVLMGLISFGASLSVLALPV